MSTELSARELKLANLSALGVYRFTWVSPSTGITGDICWGEGMTGPMVSWTPPGGPARPARVIAEPGRFGWKAGHSPGQSEVKAFVLAYARELEAEDL